MSSSSVDQVELPYNAANVLSTESDVNRILSEYSDTVRVRDINIYRKAFVHRSYCTRKNENFVNGNTQCPPGCMPLQEESNERLEFLGDAVVNLVVGRYLFNRYPDENEGFMTRIRTKLVNGTMLAHFGDLIGLHRYMMISKQIEDNEGRRNKKVLEDGFEAFVGAMLKDTDDYSAVEDWLINLIENNIDFAELINSNTNYKDMLIKHFQHSYNNSPKFFEISVETTAAGGKKYTICVKRPNGELLGIGSGPSKKQAENDASRVVLVSLGIIPQ